MAVYYLDTSALMKRYRSEVGSDVVGELFEGLADSEALVTSYLTALEVNSAANRLLGGGVIAPEVYQRLLGQFTQDMREYGVRVMSVQNELVDRAIGIVRRYALRSLDALHFASAVAADGQLSGDQRLYVVSADRELVSACGEYGIPAINPQAGDALGRLRSLR